MVVGSVGAPQDDKVDRVWATDSEVAVTAGLSTAGESPHFSRKGRARNGAPIVSMVFSTEGSGQRLRAGSAGVAVGAVYLREIADVDWVLEVLDWRGGYICGAVGF